jgi:GTP-binding protein Era
VLFLVDASKLPNEEDRQIAAVLARHPGVPMVLVLNKADLLAPGEVTARVDAYRELGEFEAWILISALRGENRDRLLELVVEYLPQGPRYFPEEQVTDQQLRFMAAELVREQVMRQVRQEVPYSVAVVVDQFKERSENLTYISANIFVERDTQKAIILGRGGEMIKRIGRDARRGIEDLVGTRVYLELWVKELRRLGYALPSREG